MEFLPLRNLFSAQFKGKLGLTTNDKINPLGLILSRITVVNPNISSSTVTGVSCAILVLVFVIQPFGTSKIASSFAPIVILWMFFNLSFGIYVRQKHEVWKSHS